MTIDCQNRKNDLILIMTPEKQDKTLELSKHWSVYSTLARNEVIMKRTYPDDNRLPKVDFSLQEVQFM